MYEIWHKTPILNGARGTSVKTTKTERSKQREEKSSLWLSKGTKQRQERKIIELFISYVRRRLQIARAIFIFANFSFSSRKSLTYAWMLLLAAVASRKKMSFFLLPSTRLASSKSASTLFCAVENKRNVQKRNVNSSWFRSLQCRVKAGNFKNVSFQASWKTNGLKPVGNIPLISIISPFLYSILFEEIIRGKQTALFMDAKSISFCLLPYAIPKTNVLMKALSLQIGQISNQHSYFRASNWGCSVYSIFFLSFFRFHSPKKMNKKFLLALPTLALNKQHISLESALLFWFRRSLFAANGFSTARRDFHWREANYFAVEQKEIEGSHINKLQFRTTKVKNKS